MECLLKNIEIEMCTKRRQRKDPSRHWPRFISKKKKKRSKLIKKLAGRVKNVWVKAVRRTGNTEKKDFCSSDNDEEAELYSDLRLTSCSDSDEEMEFFRITLLRDLQMCQGLIDIVCILYYIHSNKQNGMCSRMKWQKVFAMFRHCIPLFAIYFAGSCAFPSVIALSSLMPTTLLRMLRIPCDIEALWLSKLESLSGEDASSEAIHLASFKCLKDYGHRFSLMATNIFRAALTLRIAAVKSQNGVTGGRIKKIQSKIESESVMASKILLTTFTEIPFQTKNVAQHRKHIYEMWKSMEQIKVLVEIRLQQEMYFQDPVLADRFIKECFCCYVKLIPALENTLKAAHFNSMEEYLKLLDWADRILVTSLPMECPYTNEQSRFKWFMINTTGCLGVSLLNQILEALLLMMDNEHICLQFIHKGVRMCKTVLRTGCRLMFVSTCVKFTSKLYKCFQRNLEARPFFKTLHMVLHLLTDCISSFSDFIPVKEYVEPCLEDYEEVESIIRTILLTSVKLCGTSSKLITAVVRKFIDVILRIINRGESVVSTSDVRDFGELPFIATRFVGIFCSSANLCEVFLLNLLNIINEDCKEAQQLMACLKLLHVLVLHEALYKAETLRAAVEKAEGAVECIQSVLFSRADRDSLVVMETIVKSMKQHLCDNNNCEVSS